MKRSLSFIALLLVSVLIVNCLIFTAFANEVNIDDEEYSMTFATNIVASFPELDLSIEYLQELRLKKFGWGEIVIMAKIAVASGNDMEAIVELRNEGLGLGQIAKKLGVEVNCTYDDNSDLDEIGANELLSLNFELSENDIAELMVSGLTKRELLMVCTATACIGDSSQLEVVVSLRLEGCPWNEIFQDLNVEPESFENMKEIIHGGEVHKQIKEACKEFKKKAKEEQKAEKHWKKFGKSDEEDQSGEQGKGLGLFKK